MAQRHLRALLTPGLMRKLSAGRSQDMIGTFQAYLQPGEKLVDIGTGSGDIADKLGHMGYDVTALDVEDASSIPTVKPVVYDGTTMPFPDKTFDTALLLTVLHHTPNPETVLAEAARIARRIIIIEDVYHGRLHKYATFALDSLLNLEFIGHPHTNKTDKEWQDTFAQLHLKLAASSSMRSFGFMHHRVYVLETSSQH